VWQEARRVIEEIKEIKTSANESVPNKKLETPRKLVDGKMPKSRDDQEETDDSGANETVRHASAEEGKNKEYNFCICHADEAPKVALVNQPRKSSMKRQGP
jgi:hypothetical protein